jgi:hypothetical protein
MESPTDPQKARHKAGAAWVKARLVTGLGGLFTRSQKRLDLVPKEDEEIAHYDPFFRQNTMVKEMEWRDILKLMQKDKKRAIARKEEHFVNRSLCCLSSANFLRALMIQMVELDLFNRVILLLIILNCVFLVLDDPHCRCADKDCTQREIYRKMLFTTGDCRNWTHTEIMLDGTEKFFTIVFAVECVIKIIARGFILHKHSYLRDIWNWLDFIVVLSSVISVIVQEVGIEGSVAGLVQVLRVLRVLRPLRTMTRIKGMKPLLNTLYRAIAELPELLLILIVFLIVFGVIGMQLFAGSLHGRCFVDPQQTFTVAAKARLLSQQIPFMDMSTVGIGNWNADVQVCSKHDQCSDAVVDGRQYPTLCSMKKWCHDKWCDQDWNGNPYPGGGMFSFDNIGQSIIVVFQLITLEGWTDFLYTFEEADRTNTNTVAPNLFFHFAVILGAFFVLQLLLAVLTDQYDKAQNDAALEKEKEAMDEKAILRPDQEDHERKVNGLKQYIHNAFMWIGRNLQASNKKRSSRVSTVFPNEDTTIHAESSEADIDNSDAQAGTDSSGNGVGVIRSDLLDDSLDAMNNIWTKIQEKCCIIIKSTAFDRVMLVAIVTSTACMGVYHHSQFHYEADICSRRCDIDPSLPANASQHCHGPLYNRTWDTDGAGGGTRLPQRAFCFLDNDNIIFPQLAEDQTCAQHNDRTSCESAVGRNGLGCYFFKEGQYSEWTYSITPGCKMGLYDPNTFASNTAFWNGAIVKLGLREICGDDGSACSGFAREIEDGLEMANYVLCSIFVLELLLKMVGLGLIDYFSESMNTFDFVVVCVSMIDIIITASSTDNSQTSFAALRAVRLFRLFKLARSWKDMRRILTCLGKALASLVYNAILLALFMYIFSLLTMQFFGGIQDGSGFRFQKTDAPRQNFDTFFPSIHGNGAFFSVFQMITGENWNLIMYDAMTTSPKDGVAASIKTAIPGVVLSFFIVFVGNYIIMNVFIAILLSQFLDKQEAEEDGPVKITFIRSCMNWLSGKQATTDNKGRAGRLVIFMDKLIGSRSSRVKDAGIEMHTRQSHLENKKMVDELMHKCRHPGILRSRTPYIDGQKNPDFVYLPDTKEVEVPVFGFAGKAVAVPEHHSFGFFKPMNPMRRLIAYFVRHPIFENMILICIFITTTTLVFVEKPEDTLVTTHCPNPPEQLDCSGVLESYPGHTGNINCPRYPDNPMFGKLFEACDSKNRDQVPPCCQTNDKVITLGRMDKLFSIIFLLEMLMKMISDGVIFHELSYFLSPWNILDFIVVVTSILTAWADNGDTSIKVLRAVRVLRPLRVVKRIPGLKVAATCLLASIPAMVNVFVVVLVWYSMVAMIGVQIFRGAFYSCYSVRDQIFYATAFPPLSSIYAPTLPLGGPESVPSIIECVSQGRMVQDDSLLSNGLWTPKSNTGSFDNILSGLLTLIATSTTEGWVDMMTACSDSVAPGVTPLPQYNHNWGAWFSFVHVFMGAFVLWNVVAAEVISNYMAIKDEQDGLPPLMTKEQHDWQYIVRLILQLKPRAQSQSVESRFRYYFHLIINHPWFSRIVTAIICINTCVMMAGQHNDTGCTLTIFFWLDVFFASFFFLEAILKLVALGVRWYFADTWNVFDFIVVACSIFSVTIDYLSGYHSCTIAQSGQARSEILENIANISGMFKVIRVLRVLRLLRLLKGVRRMLDSLITSLPSLASVACLLVLMILIFAVLSATAFYNVSSHQDVLQVGIGEQTASNNYRIMYNSIRMLFRFLTGEGWQYTMVDTMQV